MGQVYEPYPANCSLYKFTYLRASIIMVIINGLVQFFSHFLFWRKEQLQQIYIYIILLEM